MSQELTFDYLWHGEKHNKPSQVKIPPGEKLYSIDLETRTIDGPEFLGAKDDHSSELIYFKVNRYYDLIDLSDTICLVQYETISKNTGNTYKGLYAIPFYDLLTLKDSEEMILVWEIQSTLTQTSSSVKYNFRFVDINDQTGKLTYSLNIQPATSKVLNSLNHEDLTIENNTLPDGSDDTEPTKIEQIWTAIGHLSQWQTLYWEVLAEE